MLRDAFNDVVSWDARTWVSIGSVIVAACALWRSERRSQSDRRETRAETDLKLVREELAEVVQTIGELQILSVRANQHFVSHGGGGEQGVEHERQAEALRYRVDQHQSVLTILVGDTLALAAAVEPISEMRGIARELYDDIGAINRAGITAAGTGLASKHDERVRALVRTRTAIVEAARDLGRDTSWSRRARSEGLREAAPRR